MSEQSNTDLMERVGELTDLDMLSDKQLDFIQKCMDISDMEGLHAMLPYIEQDVADRIKIVLGEL